MINTKKNLEAKDFLENRLKLHCPGESDIFAAYDNLPSAGSVEISCSFVDLSSVMHALEASGFFGISIIPGQELSRGVKLVAYKGKDNPCYDTGKSAEYRGSSLTALDDDHHLLFGELPVCEKTAIIYSLPGYKRVVKITGGNPELIARLKTNPAPFDCDTFESDVSRLANTLTELPPNEELSTAILYPGPFKILILDDGTMIHRGVPVLVSDSAVRSLIKSDKCIQLIGKLAENAEKPINFIDAYKNQGAVCLIEIPEISSQLDPVNTTDLSILDESPAEMKQRLVKLIESDSEYFIITGSDARDLNGCCPSDGVKAANRLVEAGVLQVARADSAPDACPVNIYAFSGEMRAKDTRPQFTINQEFRQEIKNYINRKEKSSRGYLLAALRWSLLLFVLLSLIVMFSNIWQQNDKTTGFSNIDLVKELNLPFQNGVLILQFHRTERCKFCNDMEAHTNEVLNLFFQDDLQNGKIVFRQINMELPRYEGLRKKYNLFTSTLVLIKLSEGKESRWKILTEAWHLTDKKQEFIQMFQGELIKFRKGGK